MYLWVKIFVIICSISTILGQQTSQNRATSQNGANPTSGIILTSNGNDDDSPKYRPCPVYDLDCIRLFISSRSKCAVTYGPVPDPIFKPRLNLYYPNFNLSATQTAVFFSGVGATTLDDFFIDKERKEIVIQLRFRNISLRSNKDFYVFYRNGKEPAITTSDSVANFPNFSTTTIFRGIEHIDLANSETFVFADALPDLLVLNPTAAVHPDPVVQQSFAAFLANVPVVIQEAFLTASTFLAGTYIQYNICDYRIPLYV